MSADFIPTKASLLKKKTQQGYQSVTYISHRPQKRETKTTDEEPKDKSEEAEFNLRKTKQEIIKLGMSGFDPTRKEEAKIQQLIKLGAKPPKNKFKNYKELIKEKKVASEKHVNEQKFQQLGKNHAGKSTAKGKSFDRKRRKEGILDIYGKIVKSKNKTSIGKG